MATATTSGDDEAQHAGPRPFWHMHEDDKRVQSAVSLAGSSTPLAYVSRRSLASFQLYAFTLRSNAASLVPGVTRAGRLTSSWTACLASGGTVLTWPSTAGHEGSA